jgi:hypothetical protein
MFSAITPQQTKLFTRFIIKLRVYAQVFFLEKRMRELVGSSLHIVDRQEAGISGA